MALLISLLVAGIILILAEFLLPGMVAGSIGMLCLIGAAAVTFHEFGSLAGMYVLLGEIVLGIVAVVLWLKYFPNSRLGRIFSLKTETPPQTSAPENFAELEGKTGRTITPLHPSVVAEIDGHRHDVVSEGSLIESDKEITVVKVEGARVVVRAV